MTNPKIQPNTPIIAEASQISNPAKNIKPIILKTIIPHSYHTRPKKQVR